MTNVNNMFLDALKLAISGRETSTECLSVKNDLPILIHTIQIDNQPIKVRVATDSRCGAINKFLKLYSDEALVLETTTKTRRLILKDTKISSLFIYEIKTPAPKPPRPAKSPKLVKAIETLEASYIPIPDFQDVEVKPTKTIKRK
jgi:hypothetical protein